MTGKVYLVGAGPGNSELLTLKAHRLITSASVVVVDRLVSDEIRRLIPASAHCIDVGKRANHHTLPQDEINALLVSLAEAGHDVLRLKGGDPFVFGRGGEEALALAARGIAFEVVPGITSAQGTAAALNVPLTHRGLATGLRLVTGHLRANGALELDWRGLADPATTVVVYMGLETIAEIASHLLAHGRDPSTPVLAASRATQLDQEHTITTLGTLAADATKLELESPTLFVIGEVVSLASVLGCGVGHALEELLDAAE